MEIKKKYQELALKYHPDKNKTSETGEDKTFQDINEAWKVLGNEALRKNYDAAESNRRFEASQTGAIWNEYLFSELEKTTNNEEEYSVTCRCGGLYLIDSEEIGQYQDQQETDLLVACDTCSLNILIKL